MKSITCYFSTQKVVKDKPSDHEVEHKSKKEGKKSLKGLQEKAKNKCHLDIFKPILPLNNPIQKTANDCELPRKRFRENYIADNTFLLQSFLDYGSMFL
ncbi:hypothetical protein [Jiulongibacter sp. NS-SX5]|uniref:hypothetical protein n=1 Tax=Jiulongibacter sp. NS-SX5 TaxID=3463854 RepID=UPI004057FE9D